MALLKCLPAIPSFDGSDMTEMYIFPLLITSNLLSVSYKSRTTNNKFL